MLTLEARKLYTNSKIQKLKIAIINIFGKKIGGYFTVLFLHYIPHIFFIGSFLYSPFNLLYLFVIVIGIILNKFFNGCIHMRLERALFDDKEWYGAYSLLKVLNIETNNLSTNFYKYLYCFLFIFCFILLGKFILYYITKNKPSLFVINKLFGIVLLWWLFQIIVFIVI